MYLLFHLQFVFFVSKYAIALYSLLIQNVNCINKLLIEHIYKFSLQILRVSYKNT